MRRPEAGIAVVVALATTLIVAVLLTVGSVWVVSGLRGNGISSKRNDLVQLADGVSDEARIQIVYGFQTTLLNIPNYLKVLRIERDAGTIHEVELGDGLTAAWAIRRVSEPEERYGWVDVNTTVRRGDDVQTVIRRVSFGSNQVFNLALLAETTNCMYCHLRVKGDVGSLDFLRPGHGSEGGSGQGSGGSEGGSVVDGDVYVAGKKNDPTATNVTKDGGNNGIGDTKINGAVVKGDLNLRYKGEMLPEDTDGDRIPDFPAIDRETARANATGKLKGAAQMTGVPLGQKIGNGTQLQSVEGVYEGNLVLIGTEANPINLDGDIYATGDVVIKGYVKGRGAIYSGRNTYIAGDVISVNAPSETGSGVCADFAIGANDDRATRKAKNDGCAKANIAAGRDEVRLAARGSTIIGDYTERDGGGKIVPVSQRQSADYYRAQFGMANNSTEFYFNNKTGDELTKRVDGPKVTYKTADGQIIPAENVKNDVTAVRGNLSQDPAKDAYSFAMRPGTVRPNGSFDSWMDDKYYRDELLGKRDMTFNTWRGDIENAKKNEKIDSYTARLKPDLVAAGLSDGLAIKVLERLYKKNNGIENDGPLTVQVSGNTIRVMIRGNGSYETQVKRVDAFIYSNRRIAGKSSMSPLAINGGMIAKEIGVLAPGRRWPDWAPKAGNSVSCAPGSADYVPRTEDCAFTVNYDYRLRNGGYGYNLISGNVGQTMNWKIADDVSAQVNP